MVYHAASRFKVRKAAHLQESPASAVAQPPAPSRRDGRQSARYRWESKETQIAFRHNELASDKPNKQ